MCKTMGFQEISHTADCAIRVWASDLTALFTEAALGLNSIAGVQIGGGGRLNRDVSLRAPDAESLLIAFLSELIYAQENESLAFDWFKVVVSEHELAGTMAGAPLVALTRHVKAATFHNLQIRRFSGTFEVEIVFDV